VAFAEKVIGETKIKHQRNAVELVSQVTIAMSDLLIGMVALRMLAT
jgi:hypothetical protein